LKTKSNLDLTGIQFWLRWYCFHFNHDY